MISLSFSSVYVKVSCGNGTAGLPKSECGLNDLITRYSEDAFDAFTYILRAVHFGLDQPDAHIRCEKLLNYSLQWREQCGGLFIFSPSFKELFQYRIEHCICYVISELYQFANVG